MISAGIGTGAKSVADSGAVRPGEPSLAINAPAAPLDAALAAFCVNGHTPRRIKATAPFGKAAKSESSHPLDGEPKSTGTTCPTRLPPPEYRIVKKSGPRA